MWQEIITWFPTRTDLSSSAVYQRGTVNCHEGRVDRDSDRDSIRLTGWDRSTLGKRCTLLHCTTSPSYSPSSVDPHIVYDALDLFLYILVHISMFCQSLYTFWQLFVYSDYWIDCKLWLVFVLSTLYILTILPSNFDEKIWPHSTQFCLGFVSVNYFILGYPAHTRVPVHSIHMQQLLAHPCIPELPPCSPCCCCCTWQL